MTSQSTDSAKTSAEKARYEKSIRPCKLDGAALVRDRAGSVDSTSGDAASSDVKAMQQSEPRRHKRKSRRRRRATHGKTNPRANGRRAQSSPPRLLATSCPDIGGTASKTNLSYTRTTSDDGESKTYVRSRKVKRIQRVSSADSRQTDIRLKQCGWSEQMPSASSLADAPKIGVQNGSQGWCPTKLRENISKMSIVGNDSPCKNDATRKQRSACEIDTLPPPSQSVTKEQSEKSRDVFPVVQLRGGRVSCVLKPATSSCRRYDARMRGNSPVMFKYSHIFQRRAPTINQFQFHGCISGNVGMVASLRSSDVQKPRFNLLRRSIFKNVYSDFYDDEVIDALESGDPNDAIYGKAVAFEGSLPRGLKSILKQPRLNTGRTVDKTVHFAVPNVTHSRTLRKIVCA